MRYTINKIAAVITVVILLQACKKEPNFNYPDGKVGSSRIVYFPSVKIKGDKLIIINQGAAFTDPGVEAKLNGAAIATTTKGAVDASKPGVYDLEYSASSPDGYSASDWRTVVVMSNDAQVTANDFTGSYLRASTGLSAVWTKVARGIYTIDNPGGSPAGIGGFVVTIVNYEGNKIKIPRQQAFDPSINGLNTVTSSTESYTAGPPATIKYVFLAGGYGTAVRTFVKQ